MNTLKRGSIVVGVDEVALAGQAVRWAGEQAALEGRGILLVRAASPVTTGWSTHAMDVPPGTFTSQRLHGEEMLARARDRVHAVAPGVDVEELFEVTDPRTLILRAAEGAHLVVLGSRGRGPLLSHLLGSVGVGVARRARCPVVVHRPGHPGRVHDGVVVAVDVTEDAIPVLEHAFHQASLRGLPLRVVHYVMDPRSALVGVPMVGDLSVQMEEDELALSEAMAGMRERYPDVRATVRTAPGLAEHDVVTAATRADLLVVGTHQRPAADRLLVGSVSTAVLEHATCPVAVVPVRSS
ncbi:MAG TPA: universal stress protein [Nocardioides sp.]|nr:universal stress protein [Nocardioides sp.]